MESETSELPKGLVLGRDENIHIRHKGSTSLGDVGSHRMRSNKSTCREFHIHVKQVTLRCKYFSDQRHHNCLIDKPLII